MASVAEQLIEQGVLRGWREMLLLQLRVRFGELSESAINRVNEADVPMLEVWVDRILTAPTLADVLGPL